MPDINEQTELRWEDIAPSFSIKVFQLPNTSIEWTPELLDLTTQLAVIIPHLCPSYHKKITTLTTPGVKLSPQNTNIINGIFLDVSKKTFEKIDAIDNLGNATPIDITILSNDHLFIGGFSFNISGAPSWLKRGHNGIVDIKHHLAFFFVLPPYIGVTCTHEGMHNHLGEFLQIGQIESASLPSILEPIPQKDFENAFIKGEAFYLWLQGLHKSTPTKADKKILSGPDLRQALDPFGENSYTYNAVMSSIDKSSTLKAFMDDSNRERAIKSIGYSRVSKTIWMTKTYGILEFAKRLNFIRMALQRSKTISAKDEAALVASRLGLNYLSKPISGQLIKEVDEPFEASLNFADPQDHAYSTHDLNEVQADWQTNGHLEVKDFDKSTLAVTIEAFYNWKPITKFDIELSTGTEGIEGIMLKNFVDPENDYIAEYEQLLKIIQEKGANQIFNIRFASGHILSGVYLFKPEYQDFIFDEWKSLDLKGFNCWQEKPHDWNKLDEVGKVTQIKKDKSLFSYVAKNVTKLLKPSKSNEWYLLCHDQPQEIADFVYLEPNSRRIELIHVKGAHSKGAKRSVSIDAYQVVCAQAVKNLRHLNANILTERFSEYLKKSTKAKDPSRCGHFIISHKNPGAINHDCSEFIDGLKLFPKNRPTLIKKVIVFQPHIQKTKWDDIYNKFNNKANGSTKSSLRPASMLTTILYETKLACIKQGVDFEIWNEDI